MTSLLPLWALALASGGAPAPAPLEEVTTRIPDAVVDLRYATPDNFMKKAVYPPQARCLFVPEMLAALAKVADALRPRGLRLKLWDCYRPRPVQAELWKIFPKKGFVADPKTGSNHNRGAAVDLTLVDKDGRELPMPTAYDDFSRAARHGHDGGTAASRANRETLRAAMEAQGFKRNNMEWWHWELVGAGRFPLRDDPFTAPDAGRPPG